MTIRGSRNVMAYNTEYKVMLVATSTALWSDIQPLSRFR